MIAKIQKVNDYWVIHKYDQYKTLIAQSKMLNEGIPFFDVPAGVRDGAIEIEVDNEFTKPSAYQGVPLFEGEPILKIVEGKVQLKLLS